MTTHIVGIFDKYLMNWRSGSLLSFPWCNVKMAASMEDDADLVDGDDYYAWLGLSREVTFQFIGEFSWMFSAFAGNVFRAPRAFVWSQSEAYWWPLMQSRRAWSKQRCLARARALQGWPAHRCGSRVYAPVHEWCMCTRVTHCHFTYTGLPNKREGHICFSQKNMINKIQ